MKCSKCGTENPVDSKLCRACASSLTGPGDGPAVTTKTIEITPSPSLNGTLFAGRFQVVEELGRGGMGVVYRAVDSRLREDVALKVIKPEIASDEKALERFSTELKLARKVVHRNVCRMYELMEHEGVRFISMEYVPGEDLKSFLKRSRRLDIGTALAIGAQVCDGLAEAHRLGVVHRDLKPGNIMIDKDGNAKIMDFGIARSRLEKGITGEGRMIGTLEYISPEQIGGAAADARSDIYALGVILFEMVCGTVPFEGDTAQIITQKVQGRKPADPKSVNPHVPDGLSKAILKCLEKIPERRYGSADELAAELRRIETDLPTSERAAVPSGSGALQKLTRRFRRRRLSVWPLAGLAAAALAVVFAVLAIRPRPSAPPGEAVRPAGPILAVLFFANRTNDPNLEYLQKNLCTKFISSISQLSPGLPVVDRASVYSLLKRLGLENGEYTAEDLMKIAGKFGASHVLAGQYMKLGESLQIYYDLYDLGNRPSRAFVGDTRTGKPGDLDAMVGELAGTVLASLKVPVSGSIRPIRSASPLADRLYAQARDAEIEVMLSREASERSGWMTQMSKKLREAIEADRGFAAAYWGLGDYYGIRFVEGQQLQDLNQMKLNYERAFELDPRLAGASVGLGWTRFYDQRLDEAYRYFSDALRLDPDDPEVNVNVGSFLFSIGQMDAAIRYFTKAIRSGDVSPMGPLYRRARAYMDVDRLAEADADVREMMRIETQDVPLRLLRARILAKMGEAGEAGKEMAAVRTVEPQNPDLSLVETYLLTAADEKAKALPVLTRAAADDPLRYSYFLAENYARLGMADEAVSIIREGIEKGFSKVFNYLFPYQVLASGAYKRIRSAPGFREILDNQKKIDDDQRSRYAGLCDAAPER